MRWASGCVLAVGLAGCGADDPAGRLAVGSELIGIEEGADDVLVLLGDVESSRVSGESIPAGTRVRVLGDDEDRAGPPGHWLVRVRVVEGKAEGTVGFMVRDQIRPLP